MQAVYGRQDWVDKLGLEAPKTWDGCKAYLKAMVDADPDGNGTAGWWGPMEVAMTAYKADAKMGALEFWPAGPAGEVKSGGANFFGTIVINSEASEAQIVRALALMDWLFTEDCYDLFYYGAEGWTYEVVNGERVIDAEKKKEVFNGKDLDQLYDLDNKVMQCRALTIEPLYTDHRAAVQQLMAK